MHSRLRWCLSLVLALVSALAVAAPSPPPRRVIVVGSANDDPRITNVRRAVDFWRNTFAELNLPPPLVDGGLLIAPPGARALENYAWQLSRLAGRLPDGAGGPPPPPELLALDGDVVVLLSVQRLLPFALPFSAEGRYFVAIPPQREGAKAHDRDHEVIAHEFGHTLGLRHGDDPNALMCEPCSTAGHGAHAGARALSAADRARLLELNRGVDPAPPP